MRLSAILAFVGALSLMSGLVLPAEAGPLPPCAKAASSKSGDSLVIVESKPEPLKSPGGMARKIQQFSFEIFPKEKFINAKDKMTATAVYWSEGSWAQWGVVLDSRATANWAFTSSCPLPLVTDDGEFLILLAPIPAVSADLGVLRIYRWDRMSKEIPGHGRLVTEIPLKLIWSPLKLAAPLVTTDESPQWYSGGVFTFSSDGRELIHETRWGNKVRIDLADGSVSNK